MRRDVGNLILFFIFKKYRYEEFKQNTLSSWFSTLNKIFHFFLGNITDNFLRPLLTNFSTFLFNKISDKFIPK